MSELEQSLRDYLALRQGLGHQMADAARLLPSLVSFLQSRGLSTVTVQAALDWCGQPAPAGGVTVAPRRMTAARGFARYLSGIDPMTEVPPTGLVPLRHQRPTPFIYSDAEIAELLAQAQRIGPDPLRNLTYYTLIGLLAATGLRIGEAINLDVDDVDHGGAVLTVRESKFGKSRLVPVQHSTIAALGDYAAMRASGRRRGRQPSFFVSRTGRRLVYQVVCQTFREIVTRAGVGLGAPHPPRLHDLRHRFAVVTLLSWYRDGADVQAKLPALSTHLGHREPARHLLVPLRGPGAAVAGRRPAAALRVAGTASMTAVAPTLQAFFTDRLVRQRQASPRTIAAYRDTLRLLMDFVHARTGRLPAQLDWDDLDVTVIVAFLHHLETERHNGIRTRNLRLTAIRSLFGYAALRHPEHALLIARVLAIPPKRFDKRIVEFLTAAEADALVHAPDPSRWEGAATGRCSPSRSKPGCGSPS